MRVVHSILIGMVVFALTIPGCGYHIAGRLEGRLPGDIVSLSIPFFRNETRRPDVEKVITSAFVEEFANNVEIVDKGGEAVMEGVIKSYRLVPVSYSRSDVIQEYRLKISMSIRLVRSEDGKVLWEDRNITDYDDFQVNTADVTATKEAEWKALKKMARDTARLVKERMLEDF